MEPAELLQARLLHTKQRLPAQHILLGPCDDRFEAAGVPRGQYPVAEVSGAADRITRRGRQGVRAGPHTDHETVRSYQGGEPVSANPGRQAEPEHQRDRGGIGPRPVKGRGQ